MTSRKQIAVNKRNAKRSTGPKSKYGKATASLNAIKHGLTAKTVVIRGEDPNEYDRLREGFRKQYSPLTPHKAELVQQLTDLAWSLRRFPMFLAALIESLRIKAQNSAFLDSLQGGGPIETGQGRGLTVREQIGSALTTDGRLLDGLSKLTRYQTATSNMFMRTSRELHKLQEQDESVEAIVIEAVATAKEPDNSSASGGEA